MVDIHHHLLPGLDDGAPDLPTSLAMARIAAADGITHVVCTPHANSRFEFQPDVISARVAELRAVLETEAVPLQLETGCDFHLNYENIQDALANPGKYTIAGKGYLLVELPDFGFSPQLGETFEQLRAAGMTPILTHPERNPTLQHTAALLVEWLQEGLLVQVTAGSVLGEMGRPAQRMAERLLERRWVHFLATDAHHIVRRSPTMSAARDLVAKRYGSEYAGLLCQQNPLAVYEGRPLPEQPQAEDLSPEAAKGFHARPSIWKRLTGKS